MDKVLQQVISGNTLPYDQIDKWIQDTKFQEIEQFAAALAQVWDDLPSERWRYLSAFGRLVDGLALRPGEKNLETLLTVLTHRSQDDKLMRRVSAQLATTQAPEVLDRFTRFSEHTSLWEYLLHELIIQGITIPLYKNLSQIAEIMQARQHPLSFLPLNLLSSEAEIHRWRARYRPSSLDFTLSYPPTDRHIQVGLPDNPAQIAFVETTTVALQTRLASAFENWKHESNGRIEARQFTGQNSISAGLITSTRLLLELHLDCLEDAALNAITIWNASSKEIINSLFRAAANGGAYSRGLGNAYGRLHVWKSIAALLNEPESTPITSLNVALDNIHWFQADSPSPWFYRVAWDEAIIALNTDKHILTVLAATDTD
jgi:hypothetical protein